MAILINEARTTIKQHSGSGGYLRQSLKSCSCHCWSDSNISAIFPNVKCEQVYANAAILCAVYALPSYIVCQLPRELSRF